MGEHPKPPRTHVADRARPPPHLSRALELEVGGRQSTNSRRPMRNAAVLANVNLKKRPFPAEYFEDDFVDPVPEVEARGTRSSKRARTGSGTPMSSSQQVGAPPRGTRNSSRRNEEEDEWQQVPDEWLKSGAEDADGDDESAENDDEAISDDDDEGALKLSNTHSKSRSSRRRIATSPASSGGVSPPVAAETSPAKSDAVKATIFDDDDSDLTDLSDDGAASDSKPKKKRAAAVQSDEDEDEEMADGQLDADEESGEDDYDDDADDEFVDEEYEIRIAYSKPKDWVEWETVCSVSLSTTRAFPLTRPCLQVCVTLDEWEDFPLQFEGSTNTKERALYKTLLLISDSVTEGMKVRSIHFLCRLSPFLSIPLPGCHSRS